MIMRGELSVSWMLLGSGFEGFQYDDDDEREMEGPVCHFLNSQAVADFI